MEDSKADGSDLDDKKPAANGDDDTLGESERTAKRRKTQEDGHDEEGVDEDDDDDEEMSAEDEDDEDYKERGSRKKAAPAMLEDNKNENDDADEKAYHQPEKSKKTSYIQLPGFGEHKRAVSSVKFAPSRLMKKDRPNAAICASSSADGYIKLWNVQDSWTAIASSEREVKKSSTSSSAVVKKEEGAAGDGRAENTDDGSQQALEPTVTCGGHTRGINDIAWNPVSPFLASASDDKTVRLWDMVTGEPLVEYRGHDSFVFCVDQYQHMIVSGSFDETVKLWDIRSGDCVSTLPAHSDPVTSVSFNRDGTVVCTGSHDGLIRLWDVATGECLKTIYAAGNPPVCSAKFSPNSKYILAGTLMDATLRLWPVHRTGSNLCSKMYKSEHHVNAKYSVVADFTHDGNVITGSETGKVILYDLQSQDVLQVLDAHEDAVLAVSAHDKLPFLASGAMTNDRRVHFWAPENFDLLSFS